MKRLSPGYEAPADGFSDEKLERLSQNTLSERGLTPWAAWESENSSFGKTFRKWVRYPSFLPLCFSSDHGVHWESRCWPNEVGSPYSTFFTWNKKKAVKMKVEHGKNAVHVPHPWVYYRRKYFSNFPCKPAGTLVFYAHSNATTTPLYKDLDGYMCALAQLPEKYQPITICMSFHDIEKGLHKKIRKYGFPIVTAGSTAAKMFVDRFYSLIHQFRYATSPNIGSHTYYIIEAGIPFFLFGEHPVVNIKGSNAVSDGLMDLRDYGDDDDIERLEYLRYLLSQQHDVVTEDQRRVIGEYLGLDSGISRLTALLIIVLSLIFNLPKVVGLYFNYIYKAVAVVKSKW